MYTTIYTTNKRSLFKENNETINNSVWNKLAAKEYDIYTIGLKMIQ